MYLIAGLGNPGLKYEGTRHNMGFDTVDCLINRNRIPQSGVKYHALYGSGLIEGRKVVLMKPLSYMNLSGGPVQEMASFYKLDPATQLIVVCDDVDLSPGRIRIRKQGSAGGHNGLKDIIQRLGREDFIRIRIGVGEKPSGWDLADHVLGRFSTDDRKKVDEAIVKAAEAVECILREGIDKAMNRYNAKPQKSKHQKPKSQKTQQDGSDAISEIRQVEQERIVSSEGEDESIF